MGMIEDILNALDRIPIWKRVQALPVEVETLKTRVEELEQKLGNKWPPSICKYCGERAARLWYAYPNQSHGYRREDWKCELCGKEEPRHTKIGTDG